MIETGSHNPNYSADRFGFREGSSYASRPNPNPPLAATFAPVARRWTQSRQTGLCRANSLLTGKITGNCAFSALS